MTRRSICNFYHSQLQYNKIIQTKKTNLKFVIHSKKMKCKIPKFHYWVIIERGKQSVKGMDNSFH